MSSRKRRSKPNRNEDNNKYGNEINSTGSFLSDLSVTQSEDDFLDLSSKPFKKHRPSLTAAAQMAASAANAPYADAKQTRRSARRSVDLRNKSEFFDYYYFVTATRQCK